MRFNQLSSTLIFLLSCSLSAVFAGGFNYHNSPGYGMQELPITLKNVLRRSTNLPSTYPYATIEEVRVGSHHPLTRQLSGIFKSIPVDKPSLINLGPLEFNGERNTAFAVPIEPTGVSLGADETLFALFSAHEAQGSQSKVDLHSVGFVKSRFVDDIESTLEQGSANLRHVEKGTVLSPNELIRYISEAH
ncbi:uncharacterized protein UTRI_06254_B [Ustilago trichophora]|uniref:Uncharacterized protein n=1 Tax=Ustilago trichophora TaxID=86804 RepID=A0A5C3EHC1_9BASI|nr:uncharacterized protein UTRI_06254_B [Ustilago trichophora]